MNFQLCLSFLFFSKKSKKSFNVSVILNHISLNLNVQRLVLHTLYSSIFFFQYYNFFASNDKKREKSMSLKLRPHQIEAIHTVIKAWQVKEPGFILAHEMGLGKTLTSLIILSIIYHKLFSSKGIKFVIIAPVAVLSHWLNEYEKILTQEEHLLSQISRDLVIKKNPERSIKMILYHGNKQKRQEIWNVISNPNSCLLIATSEETLRSELKSHLDNKPSLFSILPVIDVCIIDEIQRFANVLSPFIGAHIPFYAQIFQYLKRRFTLGLSGTPVRKHSMDVQSILKVIGIPIPKDLTLPGLIDLFKRYSHFAYVNQIGLQMPTTESKIIHLDYTDSTIKKKAEDSFNKFTELSNKIQHYLEQHRIPPPDLDARYKAAASACKMFDMIHVSRKDELQLPQEELLQLCQTNNKCLYLINAIHDDLQVVHDFNINNTEYQMYPIKWLIISSSVAVLHVLHFYLQAYGITSLMYEGKMNRTSRDRALQEFARMDLDACSILLLSKKAGGCGLSVWADQVIMWEPHETDAMDSQAIARAVRLGQTSRDGQRHHVTIQHLLYPLMDNHLWNQKKKKAVLDNEFMDRKTYLQNVYHCNQVEAKSLLHSLNTRQNLQIQEGDQPTQK